jgi:hypothetical protein
MSTTFTFYDSICDSILGLFKTPSDKDYMPLIDEIFRNLNTIHNHPKNSGDWNFYMNLISRILNARTVFVGNDNCSREFTLLELIESMRSEHFHQNVSTKGIHVAFPSNKKVKTVSCSFHQESLFVHSILAMVYSLNQAFLMKNVNPALAGLTGLLHDIGKPACLTQYGENLGFPFHGEYGSCILSQFFSPQIEEFVTQNEYESMVRAIGVHMCSYHTTTIDEWSTYRLMSAQIETDDVRNLILCLYYGDKLGKVSQEDHSNINSLHKSYTEFIQLPCDIKNLMKSHKFTVPCFFVRGASGAGKTHFIYDELIPLLSKYFDSRQLEVISRDVIKRQIVLLVTGGCSEDMNANVRLTGKAYQEIHDISVQRKLGNLINQKMREMISNLISQGRMPIIDSCISYYKEIMNCMPDNINRAFIISIDCVRNTIYTENDADKNGMTTAEMNKIFSTRSPMNCLPPAINLTQLAASTTHSTKPDTKWIPQLCFSHGFNLLKCVGFDTFAKTIDPIMTYFSKILELVDTNSMTLPEYVNFLYKKFGYDGMRSAFIEQGFQVLDRHQNNEQNKRIIRLKYLERNNIWRTRWSRDTRGTGLFLNDSDVWVCFKYLLQRGCEMMTGIQVSNGIDSTESFELAGSTQSDKIASAVSSSLRFDDNQRKTILSLLMNSELDGGLTLSFKKDGSLLGFSVCRDPETAKFLREFINSTHDEFAKKIMKICDTLGLPLCYFSSQSTIFIAQDMHDWTVQSLLSTIMTDDEIVANYSNRTYMDVIDEKFPEILTKLYTICHDASVKLGFPATSTLTLCMETICKNRRSIFGVKNHAELAVLYTSSSCTVLGLSMCDAYSIRDAYSMKNSPHFTFSEIISANGFIEPCYWTVSHTSEVNKILSDLNDVIFEKITEDEFFLRNPPHNIFSNWEQIIDREGFVTYAGPDNNYGKIKTNAYYIGHKLRANNIKYLQDLSKIPSARIYFPLCNEVALFHSNIVDNLKKIKEIFDKMCEDTSSPLFLGFSVSALESFQRQSSLIQLRMLINASNSFSVVAVDHIFKAIFPFDDNRISNKLEEITKFRDNISALIKSILMNFVENRIDYENIPSDFIGNFFSLARQAIQSK